MKLDHIVLYVSHMEKSDAWYAALLELIGFSRSGEHVFGNDDGLYLDLRPATEPEDAYNRFGVGLNHLGFTAPDRAAVDGIREQMVGLGFDAPDVQILGGDYCLFLKDPDGMRIEITAYP